MKTLATTNDTVVNFHYAFRALTADLVMDYCFQSDMGCINSPGFRHEGLEMFVEGFELPTIPFHFPKLFGFMGAIIALLPEQMRKEKFPALYGFELMYNLSKERVEHSIEVAEKEKALGSSASGVAKDESGDKILTMFDVMLRPDVEKGQITPPKGDLVADGCLQIAAGTDTTGNALSYLLWYITQNPDVEKRLLEELKRGIGKGEVVSSATLEGPGFEYLRAVIKEGLRLSQGVPGRIIREVPSEGATFDGCFIPGGVSQVLLLCP